MAKALNTTYEEEEIETPVVFTEKQKNNTNRLTIDSKQFLLNELKESLHNAKTMCSILEENLKRPPHAAKDVEAYSLVLSQVKEIAREIRQLEMDENNLELNQRRLDKQIAATTGGQIGTQVNNTYFLDAKQLADMVRTAKAENSLKNIEVDFKQDKVI